MQFSEDYCMLFHKKILLYSNPSEDLQFPGHKNQQALHNILYPHSDIPVHNTIPASQGIFSDFLTTPGQGYNNCQNKKSFGHNYSHHKIF